MSVIVHPAYARMHANQKAQETSCFVQCKLHDIVFRSNSPLPFVWLAQNRRATFTQMITLALSLPLPLQA